MLYNLFELDSKTMIGLLFFINLSLGLLTWGYRINSETYKKNGSCHTIHWQNYFKGQHGY